MNTAHVKTVKELLDSIPSGSTEFMEISQSSQELLQILYERAKNLPESFETHQSKPPLIISFHPKASLLNNNIHETFLAEKIAEKLGMVPLWIPYIYDTGFKSAGQKIRRPTYVYIEGKFIPLRTSAAIKGNIMATEKALNEREVKAFFRELNKHLVSNVLNLKTMLNKFNFGHFLFDLKRNVSQINKKQVNKRLSELEKVWLDAVKGTKKLDESLARISIQSFKEFGINIGLTMMDDILADIVQKVFSEVIESPSVKMDPSILENLFLAYELKSRERTEIMYTGDGDFIAYDDSANRVFEGKLETIVDGLRKHTVLPTGDLIMVLFTAMGCKLVLGGVHTINYYPDYFKKSYSVLKETSFNSKMQLLSYGKIRFMDLRNMTDIMSAIKVFDKVGSRNYIQKGTFTLPNDVVDHLNFLAGATKVPMEFEEVLKEITKDQGNDKPPALKREESRYKEVISVVNTDPEELLKDPASLKKWIRGTKFEGLHPVRLEVLLENLRIDVDMRLSSLKENIKHEQHVLGGTLKSEEDDEEGGEIIYDGIINRSNRYPSLFELVYYKCKPLEALDVGGTLKNHESEWIWKQFIHTSSSEFETKPRAFSDYASVFEKLIPSELMARLFKSK